MARVCCINDTVLGDAYNEKKGIGKHKHWNKNGEVHIYTYQNTWISGLCMPFGIASKTIFQGCYQWQSNKKKSMINMFLISWMSNLSFLCNSDIHSGFLL